MIINLILAGVFAIATHEGGHYVAALAFGKRLKFHFEWGRLFGAVPVPRWTWYMPDMAAWKQTVVAMAGFLMEFALAALGVYLGWLWGLLVASAHLLAYPAYCGESSDFNWL